MITSYLKKKLAHSLGLNDLRQRQLSLERQVHYWAAFNSLLAPKALTLNEELLQDLRKRIQEDFALSDFNATIHRNDMMLSHQLLHYAPDVQRALWGYFKVGARAARNLEALCREHKLPTQRVLDFGSGYGRVARFLPAVLPSSSFTISEVKKQAVQFQQDVLGLESLHHSTEAEAFTAQNFDLILALSVFTHLPEGHFKSWLRALTQHLKPGGALLFTFNNIALAGAKAQGAQDFCYLHHSEDSALPQISDALRNTQDYGSTFVSYSFIEAALRQINPALQAHFLKNKWVPKQEAVLVRRA